MSRKDGYGKNKTKTVVKSVTGDILFEKVTYINSAAEELIKAAGLEDIVADGDSITITITRCSY